MKENKIKQRIIELRKWMKEKGITYYVIPTSDSHQSEYVNDYFKTREFFTGFTGSNGTLVVGQDGSGLWTDGRYFVQAEQELIGSDIHLFKMEEEGVPTIIEYLKNNTLANDVVGFDGNVIDAEIGLQYEKSLKSNGVTIDYLIDAASEVWKDRPQLPNNKITVLEDEISGETVSSKIAKVRASMKKEDATQYLISKLDDVMWLFNIRGLDIPCNPVALSYGYLTLEKAYLFVQKEAITAEFQEFCTINQITIMEYMETTKFLQSYQYHGNVLCDYDTTSYAYYKIMEEQTNIIKGKDPTEFLKAIKNPVEIKNMKEVYLQDSVAVVKFLYWIKNTIGKKEITELSAAEYIDNLRKEIPNFIDLSFPTISAYKENAAMAHYQADSNSNKTLKEEGMLLIDSGGQYLGGTTDITRTIVVGNVSENCKEAFTAVVSGMLQLTTANFLYGCTGRNLDILARQPMWDLNIDYKHGTGHGIGYILNVHEGPQNIRWRFNEKMKECYLEAGMTISNEPGVYKVGDYGIRIENILLCKEGIKNEYGQFMCFESLTYVPIDLKGINVALLTKENKERLNSYHKQVFKVIKPFLNEKETDWLEENTRII